MPFEGPPSTPRPLYDRALTLAQQGDCEGAFRYMAQYLRTQDDDGEAWNDAGVLLYQMGRFEEAARYLERGRELECDSGVSCANLFHAYIKGGRTAEAVELMEEMQFVGVLTTNAVKEAVGLLKRRGDIAGAMEIAVEAQRHPGHEAHIREIVEGLKASRARIAFFCGGDGDTFLRDIYAYVARRFEVRLFEGQTVEDVAELMAWSDISWFEWCTNIAEIGSKLPRVCRNIVRLHRYEAYEGWCERVSWTNVDTLITVGNSSVREEILRHVPDLERLTRLVTIPNGVDMDRIRFVRRKRGRNIAFVANMRMVKNPMFLLQCMKKLHEIDAGYRLFIAGKCQDMVVIRYMRHMIDALGLNEAVIFDGWQPDIGAWLGDKHYIVLTSVIESQGMGAMEGMAAGLKGVIHNFPGAEGIYPQELLFNTPEEFCRIVTSEHYMPSEYRSFVDSRYSLRDQLRRIGNLLCELEKYKSGHETAVFPPDKAACVGVQNR